MDDKEILWEVRKFDQTEIDWFDKSVTFGLQLARHDERQKLEAENARWKARWEKLFQIIEQESFPLNERGHEDEIQVILVDDIHRFKKAFESGGSETDKANPDNTKRHYNNITILGSREDGRPFCRIMNIFLDEMLQFELESTILVDAGNGDSDGEPCDFDHDERKIHVSGGDATPVQDHIGTESRGPRESVGESGYNTGAKSPKPDSGKREKVKQG